jgi:hypothetical protein
MPDINRELSHLVKFPPVQFSRDFAAALLSMVLISSDERFARTAEVWNGACSRTWALHRVEPRMMDIH